MNSDMMQLPSWPTGSQVVYREVWRGKVWTARPVIVVILEAIGFGENALSLNQQRSHCI